LLSRHTSIAELVGHEGNLVIRSIGSAKLSAKSLVSMLNASPIHLLNREVPVAPADQDGRDLKIKLIAGIAADVIRRVLGERRRVSCLAIPLRQQVVGISKIEVKIAWLSLDATIEYILHAPRVPTLRQSHDHHLRIPLRTQRRRQLCRAFKNGLGPLDSLVEQAPTLRRHRVCQAVAARYPRPPVQACGQGNPRRDGLRPLLHPVLKVSDVIDGVLVRELRRIQIRIKHTQLPIPAWTSAPIAAVLRGHAVQFVEFLIDQV
jgi:hypothetical protein